MAEKFWENFEKIDNEEINKNIENKEKFIKEKLENKEVLLILNKIDNDNPNIDIDLTYDNKSQKYFLILNWKINPKWLTFEEFKNRFWNFVPKNLIDNIK